MMGPYLEGIRSRIGSRRLLLPGVRAIILDADGRALLQRRTDLGCWGLPSGSVELEETAAEALRREVREETGLIVNHAEPMGLYSGPDQRFRYPNGDEIQCFSVAFIVRDWDGVPQADGVEGREVRFWRLEALPSDIVAIHARTLNDFEHYRGAFLLPDEHRRGKE